MRISNLHTIGIPITQYGQLGLTRVVYLVPFPNQALQQWTMHPDSTP